MATARCKVSRFFKYYFAYSIGSMLTTNKVILPCLSMSRAESLSFRFTFEELDKVISQIDRSKILGPNRF